MQRRDSAFQALEQLLGAKWTRWLPDKETELATIMSDYHVVRQRSTEVGVWTLFKTCYLELRFFITQVICKSALSAKCNIHSIPVQPAADGSIHNY